MMDAVFAVSAADAFVAAADGLGQIAFCNPAPSGTPTTIVELFANGGVPVKLIACNTRCLGLVAGTTYYVAQYDAAGAILHSTMYTQPAAPTLIDAGTVMDADFNAAYALTHTYNGADATGYVTQNYATGYVAPVALTNGTEVPLTVTAPSSGYGSTRACALSVVIDGATTAIISYTIKTARNPNYNRNRFFNRIKPKNVLVCYRTDQTGTDTIANHYQTNRFIPAANMLALDSVTPAHTATSHTIAQATDLLQKIVAGMEACPHPIRAILLIGDYPSTISDKPYDTPWCPLTFWTAITRPKFSLAEFQKDAAVPYPGPLPATGFWNYQTLGQGNANAALDGRFESDCWINPPQSVIDTEFDAVAVCNFPIGPTLQDGVNGVTIAMQRIDDCIAAERARYSDWGTCLLALGHSNVSSTFLQEIGYELETYTPSNVHWYLPAGGSIGDHPSGFYAAVNDPSGWAAELPGHPNFGATKPDNVFLRSHGIYNYQLHPYWRVEQPGDYNYRVGAIAICSQSYGAAPGSGRFVDNYRTGPTFSAVAEAAVHNDAVFRPLALDTNSQSSTFIQIARSGKANDGHTAVQTANEIILKLSGVEQGRVTFAGLTVQQVIDAIHSLVTSINVSDATAGWSATCSPANRMSRALAAWRAGAAVACGVSAEPLATGHVKTTGLYTTLQYGGNIAEWLLRAHGGSSTFSIANGLQSVYPVSWVCYADPLYAPFINSRLTPMARVLAS